MAGSGRGPVGRSSRSISASPESWSWPRLPSLGLILTSSMRKWVIGWVVNWVADPPRGGVVPQQDVPGRPVAVFRDDDLQVALVLARPVEQQVNVGVRLDRPGLAVVRQSGSFPRPLLHLPVELRQNDHGDGQVAGE